MKTLLQRIIGQVVGDHPGPTVIITGAIHGNEPAGVYAARTVCAALDPRKVHGEVLAVAGNLAAAKAGERGLQGDLNRLWTPELIQRALDRDDHPERHEQRELLGLFDAARARARGPIIGLDLHTTSGGGPPFSVAGDTLRNLALALALPVPLILGLEESLDGTLMQYYGDHGEACMTVETGQHDDPVAAQLHEGVIWLTLVAAGVLAPESVPDRKRHAAQLRSAAGRVPRTMELLYRHAIEPFDGFEMVPGYTGFQRVRKGELLGKDHAGEVRAPKSGRILMPLYQPQGTEGFFIVKDLGAVSRAATRTLRRLKADALLPWLPGLDRDEAHAHILHLRASRGPAIRVAELLGYRRRRADGEGETLSRKR